MMTMALTPLHATPPDNSYITDCERFAIYQTVHGYWHVNTADGDRQWLYWLVANGLANKQLQTCQEAIDVLTEALNADELMDATTPPHIDSSDRQQHRDQ